MSAAPKENGVGALCNTPEQFNHLTVAHKVWTKLMECRHTRPRPFKLHSPLACGTRSSDASKIFHSKFQVETGVSFGLISRPHEDSELPLYVKYVVSGYSASEVLK